MAAPEAAYWLGSTASNGVWTKATSAPAAGDIAIVMREQDVRVDAKSPRKRAMRDKRA